MKKITLVAGGTGGHINAAIAIGEAFETEGWLVNYITGKRILDYKLFKDVNVTHLDSKPLRTKNPFELIKNILLNFCSFFLVLILFIKQRPKCIVGAGGYVCGPTLLAGFLLRIPIFIIEQNAVMGLTNRILGWISSLIFVHFSQTIGLSHSLAKKVRVTGNPTRKSIRPVMQKPFDGTLRVLIFGGSLGADQINKIVWEIVKNPPFNELIIHHQTGTESKISDGKVCVEYIPMKYIDDMQKEYDWCDVIIARSGASTVSELAIIKKPVLIFPFPLATDNHQFLNAKIFEKDSDFTVTVLDPRQPHEKSLYETREFLVKASRQELKYSKEPSPGNHSCDDILKEIKSYVGLA